uniref:Uncharacterized protein n=1 Tax=Romanomermis culicivorax TaxID=13658 RepID=A0A915JM04_ROMCU
MDLNVACDPPFLNDSESKSSNFYGKKLSQGDVSATTSNDFVDTFKDGNCISDQSSSPASSKFSLKKFMAIPLNNFSTSSKAHKLKMTKISNGTNKTDKLINGDKEGLRLKLYHSFPNLHQINQTAFRRETSARNLHKLGRQSNIDKCCDLDDENVK